MKLIKTQYIAILILIIIVAGASYFFIAKPALDERASITEEIVHNEDVSLTFSYPSGDSGYALIEPEVTSGLKKTYVLMETKEYIKIHNDGFTESEAPPAISIFVFPESEESVEVEGESVGRIARLQNWATKNDAFTSFSKVENTPDIVEIDGVKLLHYTTDGLYKNDIYLASYRDSIYMFVGQYESSEDEMYKAFENLMTTVVFE